MIIATIDRFSGETPVAQRFFRGKEIPFWLQQMFPDIPFHPLNECGSGFDHILIFHPDHFFPGLSRHRREQIYRFLKSSDPDQPNLFSFPGNPFFAASRSFFTATPAAIRPGVFQELIQFPALRDFPDSEPMPVSRPSQQPMLVEQQIVNLQIELLLENGVKILDFGHFYIEGGTKIGRGTLLHSNVVITGNSVIGEDVRIHPNCFVENSRIGNHCTLLPGSVVIDSQIEDNVQLGPYCHLRMGTVVKSGAKVGNFVEMKKSTFGEESKAMHLSYIGDATVGKDVNVGAGTITCNFDGEKKNPTFIEDGVFIGSGTELVAPLTVQKNAYVAAGSTITQDVPANALGIARERQKNIDGWVLRKKRKKQPQRPK